MHSEFSVILTSKIFESIAWSRTLKLDICKAAFCIPIEDCEEEADTLAVYQVFQQASDFGASAFGRDGEAVRCASGGVGWRHSEHDVDVSAYGFHVEEDSDGDGDDVLAELHKISEKGSTRPSLGTISVNQVAAASLEEPPTYWHMARVCPRPTEEFPGGIELLPVSGAFAQPFSVGACSFAPSEVSFVEPEEKSSIEPIEASFVESDGELLFLDSDSEKSFLGAPDCASEVRSQQAVGCGTLPFGLLPHFILLACLLGIFCFGIAGVAAGFGGINNNNACNSVTEDPVVPVLLRLHLVVNLVIGLESMAMCPPTVFLSVSGRVPVWW
ncbi:hypothetical protein CYMTET_41847 [Cymbomonas tetramitiformis]|uniref:Transmembrane protein n=1 Tax=Cymbomonas tetramitiformis TaxID=36881 RepID=A0AAE0F237_9CHLO|nr:hypothetical protein CYMTET_41847 [Cymbomonas tetramitiformis]